jgi:orotidine-5'-phosphate decarboxylase
MKQARELDYYILLDVPEYNAPRSAELLAENLFSRWDFDGLVLNPYLGSEGIAPFADRLKDTETDLFLVLRTPNRSAAQIQDLLTGTRLVYTVAADLAKRLGENYIARCGYSRIGGLGAATSGESLQLLRAKYPQMFLLVDGLDHSGANGKNCSYAFDKLGHGAIVSVESAVLSAWKEEDGEGVSSALAAARRLQKNLSRYVDIL